MFVRDTFSHTLLLFLIFHFVALVPVSYAAPPEDARVVWDFDRAHRDVTATRERICINGLWRWQPANLTPGQPSDQWGYFKVPGPWPGITDYMQKDSQRVLTHPAWESTKMDRVRAAWYQREIEIEERWVKKQIRLEVLQLHSLATVFLDDLQLGSVVFPGGELELPRTVATPGKHLLTIHVAALPLQSVLRSFSDSASEASVEGMVARRGLCGDIFLNVSSEGPKISDIRFASRLQEEQLDVYADLDGLSASESYRLKLEVVRDGVSIKSEESEAFDTGRVIEGRLQKSFPWKADRYWDIHTPQHVEWVTLSLLDHDGQIIDQFWPQRVGFRQFEIRGRDFYLNGTRIYLSAVPLDNALVSSALASYDGAKESLLRLKRIGINFVYGHNYDCEPGSHLAYEEILRAADEVGMLVALTQPHFSNYDWRREGGRDEKMYRQHARYYARVAGNHPSAILYSMSHNSTGYEEDMNPDMFGIVEPERDNWSRNNMIRALRAEAIVREVDPTREVYHHASGNLGIMHNSNFYPNFAPIQELSDWFEPWSRLGTKPAFTCEYGAPFTWDWAMFRGWYRGERSFGSGQVPWELCMAEWNAQFVGDRAFDIQEEEKINLQWEAKSFREGKTWHRWDYPVELSSKRFDLRHEIIGRYLEANFRAFRTLGLSANSPWEHDHYFRLRPTVRRQTKELPTQWEALQRPGYSPDYIGPTYERMDLAFEYDDWEATPDGQALLRNNQPLLAYIAGAEGEISSKAHCYFAGESVSKQLVVINNSRVPVSGQARWRVRDIATSWTTMDFQVATGEQVRLPISFSIPLNEFRPRAVIEAEWSFDSHPPQFDRFEVDVLPRLETDLHAQIERLAVFDPLGETRKMLDDLGFVYESVDANNDLSSFQVLLVGKKAISAEGQLPDISRVRDGLKVIVFEQTSEALQQRFGFRVQEYGLRDAFPRCSSHPILRGIDATHLCDWQGEATLLPERLRYELVPMHGPTVEWNGIKNSRVWRCGNRGNVASVLIEKPTRGDFLPLVDGGFSLQYSPLLVYREGSGTIVFCQLDVTGRTRTDAAAVTLVANLIRFAAAPTEPRVLRSAYYTGAEEGFEFLKKSGLEIERWNEALHLESANTVLVIGPNASFLADAAHIEKPTHRQNVENWIQEGGHVVCIGMNGDAIQRGLPRHAELQAAEYIHPSQNPSAVDVLFLGIGPADLFCRDPRTIFLVRESKELPCRVVSPGVLSRAEGANVSYFQLVPWEFSEDSAQPSQRKTRRRSAFALQRLLSNLDVLSRTPLLEWWELPVSSDQPTRLIQGLYQDSTVAWDDPYRFFRW